MIVVYTKPTKAALTKEVNRAIKGVTKWFEDNPKRKVCNVGWYYDEVLKVKRNSVESDIRAAAKRVDTK